VTLVRTQLGVGVGCDALSVPYAMPAESICVHAFVGYKSQGTTAIGCVARMCGGEIWVVPGSTAPSDCVVQRLRRRTAVHGQRVWFGGGGSAGMELLRGKLRRLNTEDPDDAEQRAALWVRGEMAWELSVVVTSTAAHCDCAGLV
jgi:hypothetical protein